LCFAKNNPQASGKSKKKRRKIQENREPLPTFDYDQARREVEARNRKIYYSIDFYWFEFLLGFTVRSESGTEKRCLWPKSRLYGSGCCFVFSLLRSILVHWIYFSDATRAARNLERRRRKVLLGGDKDSCALLSFYMWNAPMKINVYMAVNRIIIELNRCFCQIHDICFNFVFTFIENLYQWSNLIILLKFQRKFLYAAYLTKFSIYFCIGCIIFCLTKKLFANYKFIYHF